SIRARHHILRLDVPMDDPGGVRSRERARHLRRNIERCAKLEPPAGDLLAHGLALDEFSGDEMDVAALCGCFANLVNGDNGWMVERRGGARFLLETPQPVGVSGE